MLYQLSYSRECCTPHRARGHRAVPPHAHGAEGNRTPDLLNAIQALSQLSYSPFVPSRPGERETVIGGTPRVNNLGLANRPEASILQRSPALT